MIVTVAVGWGGLPEIQHNIITNLHEAPIINCGCDLVMIASYHTVKTAGTITVSVAAVKLCLTFKYAER